MAVIVLGIGQALIAASALLAAGGSIVWLGIIAYRRSKQK